MKSLHLLNKMRSALLTIGEAQGQIAPVGVAEPVTATEDIEPLAKGAENILDSLGDDIPDSVATFADKFLSAYDASGEKTVSEILMTLTYQQVSTFYHDLVDMLDRKGIEYSASDS